MAGTSKTYTGEDATINIYSGVGGAYLGTDVTALSDFSLTISRGTNEQELIAQKGNLFLAGSRTVEGSLTSCKLTQAGVGNIVRDMLNTESYVKISGNCGSNSLHFYLVSCQVTGFDFSLGDADSISEGSIDFSVLEPYKISTVSFLSGQDGALITNESSAVNKMIIQ